MIECKNKIIMVYHYKVNNHVSDINVLVYLSGNNEVASPVY